MSLLHARGSAIAALSIALASSASCATSRTGSDALTTPGAGLRTPIMFGPEVAIRSRLCAPGSYARLREYHTRRTVRESSGGFGTSRTDVEEGAREDDIPRGAAVRDVVISVETATERPSHSAGNVSSGSGVVAGAMMVAAGLNMLAGVAAAPTFRGTIEVRGDVVALPREGCAPIALRPAEAAR